MNATPAAVTVRTWDGQLPIDDDTVRGWVRDGVTRVRIHFVMDLGSIIDATGMDEFNALVDETVGVSLTDLAYGFAAPARDDGLAEDSTLMWVEGGIDEIWFDPEGEA